MLSRVMFVYFMQADRVFVVILIQVICRKLRSISTKRRCKVVRLVDCVGEFWEFDILAVACDNACPVDQSLYQHASLVEEE